MLSSMESDVDEQVQNALRCWEVSRLVEVGISPEDAGYLTEAGISWHEVERLIRLGCRPDMIVEILL